MTSPAELHTGNKRWQIHCPNPHPDPGCWCYEEQQAVRQKLVQLLWGATVHGERDAVEVADRLLTDNNLRIELR